MKMTLWHYVYVLANAPWTGYLVCVVTMDRHVHIIVTMDRHVYIIVTMDRHVYIIVTMDGYVYMIVTMDGYVYIIVTIYGYVYIIVTKDDRWCGYIIAVIGRLKWHYSITDNSI